MEEDGEGICRIGFVKQTLKDRGENMGRKALAGDRKETSPEMPADTPLLRAGIRQLEEYLSGNRQQFDLPLSFYGTEFQVKVWKALLEIPYGKTASYGDIAAAVGNPKACRAVGMANHANPIVIVVPCHRIIGANGSLTGYGGGLEVKRRLLQLEGVLLQN